MKKLFTLLAANMLIMGGVYAQESEETFFSNGGETGQISQILYISPDGKYMAGQEGAPSYGNVVLWDTETNDYKLVNKDGIEAQAWGVNNDGTVYGYYNNRPAIKRLGAEEWTMISDKPGDIRGCNADGSVFVGILINEEDYTVSPVMWKQNGEKYEETALEYPETGVYYEAGVYATGISGDSKVILGMCNDADQNFIVWKLGDDGKYTIDNVADRFLTKEGSRYVSFRPERISPNGKYVTGLCYHDYNVPEGEWSYDQYAFRYDVEADTMRWLPFPEGVTSAPGMEVSTNGADVANDGTLTYIHGTNPADRKAYVVRGKAITPIPLAEYLSYSNVEMPEKMATAMSVNLIPISGDAKKMGGFFVDKDANMYSFFFHIAGLQLDVDNVEDDAARNDDFCHVQDGQLYIPEGCDEVYVYSIAGVQVYAATANCTTTHNLSSLAKGIYVVKAVKEGKAMTTKIVL